jgi:hypothetical protein
MGWSFPGRSQWSYGDENVEGLGGSLMVTKENWNQKMEFHLLANIACG